MATDSGSAVGQSNTAYTAFSTFFSQVNAYLAGGSTCPDFSDLAGTLDYSVLHTSAVSDQSNNANYPAAAAVENTHHIAAVLREFGMRTKTKANYYTDGQSDSLNESNYYTAMTSYYGNMLQGVYTPGATS
jgi:hypothetical protein